MFRRSWRAIAPGLDQLESRQLLSSAGSATAQVTVSTPAHQVSGTTPLDVTLSPASGKGSSGGSSSTAHQVSGTTPLDVTSSSASGKGSSSGSSSTAGLSSTGLASSTTSSSTVPVQALFPNDFLVPSISGTTSSGTAGVQALVTQVSSTQTQPLAQQATVLATVNQSTAPSPALGQSRPQQPQIASSSLAIDESTTPNWLIEDATGVPSPTTAQKTAPATDQKAAPYPTRCRRTRHPLFNRPPPRTSRWTIPRRVCLTRHLHEKA